MGARIGLILLAAAVGLSACSTSLSVAEAERRCAERARLADGVGGNARIGLNSQDGVRGGLQLTITDDVFRAPPQDSADIIYENCVIQSSGQAPTRPLGLVSSFDRSDL